MDINGASANEVAVAEPEVESRGVSREVRLQQVLAVMTLIEQGNSERSACFSVGINRNTFRFQALACGAGNHYARATAALAHEQIMRMEAVLERLEAGEVDAQAARVLVDARKWFASKLLPKQYGEHATVQHTHTLQAAELSEEEIRNRLAELTANAGEQPSPTPLAETPELQANSANE